MAEVSSDERISYICNDSDLRFWTDSLRRISAAISFCVYICCCKVVAGLGSFLDVLIGRFVVLATQVWGASNTASYAHPGPRCCDTSASLQCRSRAKTAKFRSFNMLVARARLDRLVAENVNRHGIDKCDIMPATISEGSDVNVVSIVKPNV